MGKTGGALALYDLDNRPTSGLHARQRNCVPHCVGVEVGSARRAKMQALRSLLGGGGDERLTPYEHSVDYPPREIGDDNAACEAWYKDVFGAVEPLPPDPSATPRERQLCRMSASEYVEARRAGSVTCEEYASALVKRALYYRYMNQWIYTSYALFDKAVADAAALDARAEAEGVESIAPLYGLAIPMK
eukprot:COSAG04_NODE_1339_length_7155_cov_8.375992_3_plen_188_part_01